MGSNAGALEPEKLSIQNLGRWYLPRPIFLLGYNFLKYIFNKS